MIIWNVLDLNAAILGILGISSQENKEDRLPILQTMKEIMTDIEFYNLKWLYMFKAICEFYMNY